MALSLPWIARQFDNLPYGRLDALPGQIATGRISASTGLQQSFSLRPAATQRCQNRRRALAGRKTFCDRTGQHRLRSDLDENVAAILSHRIYAAGELYWVANISAEIGPIEAHILCQAAGYG
jgi:hypothetical protein